MPTAVKLSAALVDLARDEGRVLGRSIAGQVEHWARLGRTVERAPGFGYERVRAALSAQVSFDDLRADERAAALAELEDYLEHLPCDRDAAFFARLRAAGVVPHGEGARRPTRRASRRRA
jgi:hypothetical protein